jgi:WD40 repeat protein
MSDYKQDKITPAWKLPFDNAAWPLAVAFAGSQQRVVAANQDGAMLLWDLPAEPVAAKVKDDNGKEIDGFETPAPARMLVGHDNSIQRILCTPDGKTLVSISLDKSVLLWDLASAPSGEAEIVLDRERRKHESRRVEEKKRADILNAPGVKVPTIASAATLEGHKEWINALGMTPDGQRIITGDDAGQVIVWDVAKRAKVNAWQCPGVAWIVSAALSPDGQTALVSQYRRKGGDYNNYPAGLRFYDVASGQIKLDVLAKNYADEKNPPYQYQYKYHEFIGPGLVATAFSPDGKFVACGMGGEEGKGVTHLVEVETGKVVRSIGGHQYGVCDLCFTKDGKHLLTSGRDTMVRILQVEDGKEVAKFGKPRGGQFTDWISAISLSPDEKWLAGADIAGHVQVWKLG